MPPVTTATLPLRSKLSSTPTASSSYNLCRDVRFFATPPIDGAFATYVTIHKAFAFALPDSVSDEAGALMEPLSVGVWACRKAGVSAGDRVLVAGAGPIGLLAAQTARAFGATEITITDVNPHRLALAERTGVTRAINVAETPLEDAGVEADALLECSGQPPAFHTRPGFPTIAPIGATFTLDCQFKGMMPRGVPFGGQEHE